MNCCLMSLVLLPTCKLIISHEFVIRQEDLLRTSSINLDGLVDPLTISFRTCDLPFYFNRRYASANAVNVSLGDSARKWIVNAC